MFEPSKLYLTNDPALRVLAAPQTMVHWRREGRGPAYIKAGGRVLYRGDDLNDWIERQRVDPSPQAA